MRHSTFVLGLLALAVPRVAAAATKDFHAEPDPDNEHDPSSGAAITAVADFTVDTTSRTLCGKVTVTPSTTVLTAMHIHLGAQTDNGAILISLPDTGSSGVININFTTIPASAITALTNEPTYLNLFTAGFPSGAARAQLETEDTPSPCTGNAVDYQSSTGIKDAGTSDAGNDAGQATGPVDSGSTVVDGSSGSPGVSTQSSGQSESPADAGAGEADAGLVVVPFSSCDTSGPAPMSPIGAGAALGLVLAACLRKRLSAQKRRC